MQPHMRRFVATALLTLVASPGCNSPCSAALDTLYPKPRYADAGNDCRPVASYCLGDSGNAAPETVRELRARLAASGVVEQAAACETTIAFDAAPISGRAWDAWSAAAGNDERYAIAIRPIASRRTVHVMADGDRGALLAVRALAALLAAAPVHAVSNVDLVDYPSMPVRGIVEGFYGPPYTIDERARLMRLMADLRQNTYLYGPKDDDFAHLNWATPYSADAGAAIAAAVAGARANRLRFIWAINPGANVFGRTPPESSIRFSSDADFAALVAKIESVRALGVADFALFLDDNLPALQFAEDNARFDTLAAAHRYLANRFVSHLRNIDSSAELYFIGTDYSEYFPDWESYNRILADGLDAHVRVMWTGRQTFSETVTATDAQRIAAVLRRKVIFWDNEPESVDAIWGRAPDLGNSVLGMLSNPTLNEWRYHPVTDYWQAIGPIGAYMWRTDTYKPNVAWKWWKSAQPPGLTPPPD